MSKKKDMNITKLFVLSNLLVECLDELKPTNKKVIQYKADLTVFIEEMNELTADSETTLKSTYFHEIANKIDTIIRQNLKDGY